MKRLSLIVLVVSLLVMVNNVSASITAVQTGNWTTTSTWDKNIVPDNTEEVKIGKGGGSLVVTINSDVGTYDQKIDTFWDCKLEVVTDGKITETKEFHIGDAGASGDGTDVGYMDIAGGTVDVIGSHKFFVGYKNGGDGTLTISSGTLMSSSGDNARLYVGCGSTSGSIGRVTVVGTGPTSISISGKMYIANAKTDTEDDPGTGTVEFQIASGGVTPIQTAGVVIDGPDSENAVAILDLSAMAAPPEADITLITGDVTGQFDMVLDDGGDGTGDQGSLVVLNYGGTDYLYTLDYTGSVVLRYIPEPATIALLGLGALVAVRRPRKK